MGKYYCVKTNKVMKVFLYLFLVFVMSGCNMPQSTERQGTNTQENEDVIKDAVIDEYWSYRMAYDHREHEDEVIECKTLMGLYVEYNCVKIENGERKHHKELLMFDDEMDYNPYIAEWMLAYCVAKELFAKNQEVIRDKNGKIIENKYGYGKYRFKRDVKELNEMLTGVRDLPNVDENLDPEIQEIFRKVYYNCKKVEIYMPDEGYGYRKYPISGYGKGWDAINYVSIKRVKSQKGELVIVGSSY